MKRKKRGEIATILVVGTAIVLAISALGPLIVQQRIFTVKTKAAEDSCRSVIQSVSFYPETFSCTITATSGTDIVCGIKSDINAWPINCPWKRGLTFQCPREKFTGVSKVYIGGLYNKPGTSCYNDWNGSSANWQEYALSEMSPTIAPPISSVPTQPVVQPSTQPPTRQPTQPIKSFITPTTMPATQPKNTSLPSQAPQVPLQLPTAQPTSQLPTDVPPTQSLEPTNTTFHIDGNVLAKINYLTDLASSKFKIVLVTQQGEYTTWKNQGYTGASSPSIIHDVLTSGPMLNHLSGQGFWSTAHEDLPMSRNYSCSPNCQFWIIEGFKSGSNGTIAAIFNHESIHNMQAADDGNLAEHVCYYFQFCGTKQDINKAYQSIIEGSATDRAGGGMPWYNKFVLYYRSLQNWANNKGHTTQFQAAENGDWNAFNQLYNDYESDKGIESMHKLLSQYGI